jgi:predicted lipid-binding transport protein (Tim44 family)
LSEGAELNFHSVGDEVTSLRSNTAPSQPRKIRDSLRRLLPRKGNGLSRWIAIVSGGAALGMIGWAMFGGDGASAGLFFGAGGLLLIALLAGVAVLLSALERSEASRQPTLAAMGLRNGTRRRSRCGT